MPKFINVNKLDAFDHDRSLKDVEVHITLGEDPIIIVCDEQMAEQLVDAREILKKVAQNTPKIVDYNAKLLLFLHRLIEVWPRRTPPSWNELLKILNESKMYTPGGSLWQRANMIQKIMSLEFDKQRISNPNGDVGSIFKTVDVDEEIGNFMQLLEDNRNDDIEVGGMVYPDTSTTKTSNNFDLEDDI